MKSKQLLWILVAVLLTSAHAHGQAVTADSWALAPQTLTPENLKSRLRSYSSVNAPRLATDVLQDSSAIAEGEDLLWQLQEAINNGQRLDDTVDVGVEQRADGSIDFDLKQHPEWMPLHQRLRLYFGDPRATQAIIPSLLERGFRDQDIDALQVYLQANRLERVSFQANQPLNTSFAAAVRSDTANRISITQVKAVKYRGRMITNEAQRKWAEGLLNSLRGQARRIVVSLAYELPAFRIIGPDSDIEGKAKEFLKAMRSPEYNERMQLEEQKYQKEQQEYQR